MNAEALGGDGTSVESGQADAAAIGASTVHPGRPLRTTLTTHEFVYQGDRDWMLMQRCYTHTGISLVPLKSYEFHGISDKQAALDDAEQHILGSGGRKGQWSGTTPTASRYDIVQCIPIARPGTGASMGNQPPASFDALAEHVSAHGGREDLIADLLGLPTVAVPADEMPDARDLIARARDEFASTDALHRDLATALETTRTQLFTLSLRVRAQTSRFRALSTQWAQADSTSDLKAASTAHPGHPQRGSRRADRTSQPGDVDHLRTGLTATPTARERTLCHSTTATRQPRQQSLMPKPRRSSNSVPPLTNPTPQAAGPSRPLQPSPTHPSPA